MDFWQLYIIVSKLHTHTHTHAHTHTHTHTHSHIHIHIHKHTRFRQKEPDLWILETKRFQMKPSGSFSKP